MKTLDQLDIQNKRVLIRSDLNVPIVNGEVTSKARIEASLPTFEQALSRGASVMVMSHLGRPKEGEPNDAESLAPVARCLSELMGREVRLVKDWIDGVSLDAGELVLLERRDRQR